MITKLHHQQSGQILVMSLIILTLLIVNSVLIIGGSLTYNQSSKYSLQDVQAINVAEAGLDKAIASINKTAGNYNGESETSLGEGSYSVTVSTIDASTKQIVATGYIPDKATAKVKRSVTMQLVKDSGVSFTYGLQAGQGGLDMSGGALVTGSVYSNNNIVMSGGATINGDAYVAGGTQPNPDQSADCTGVNCADYTFGKNVSGQNILDVAQSFRPTSTAVINKVALKIKKQGTPRCKRS
jgi:Tfp pilus assembly protein PilX